MFIPRRRDILPIPLPPELLLQLEDPLEPTAQLAHDTFLLNIFSVAALTWLAYDMVLNFNREIMLVWKRWHEPKGRHSRRIYMVVRYFSLFSLAWYVGVNTSTSLSLNFCRAWYYIVVVNMTIITLLPDVMLLMRVNSVYGWNIRTLLFTSFLFMIQLATSLVVGILSITSASPSSSSLSPLIPGCPTSLRRSVAEFTLVAWIPSILAQATYLILMLNTLAHLMRGLGLDESSSSPSSSMASSEDSHQSSAVTSNLASNPPLNLNVAALELDDNVVDLSSNGHSEMSTGTMAEVDGARGRKGRWIGGKKLKKNNFKGKEREAFDTALPIPTPPFTLNQHIPSTTNSSSNLSSTATSSTPSPTQSKSKLTKPKPTQQLPPSVSKIRNQMPLCILCAQLRTIFSWKALQQVRRLVPTMMVFMGHGWLYFGIAICVKIANAVLVTTQSGPLQAAAIPWTMALIPILVTRIYLSMVEYLHFGLPAQRPRLLASYNGEEYAGFEGEEEWDVEGGYDDDWEDEGEEYEGYEPEGGADVENGDGTRQDGEGMRTSRPKPRPSGRRRRRGPGRITFAVRDSGSLVSLASRTGVIIGGPSVGMGMGMPGGRDSGLSSTYTARTFLTRSQSLRMSLDPSVGGSSAGGAAVVLDFRDEEY